MNPFEIWSRYVDDAKYEKDLNMFMDHYEISAFDGPDKGSMTYNAFFQAKYGMFYCYDNNKRYGLIDYDPTLIQYWERTNRKLKRTWNMAIMAAISDNKVSWQDLEPYRKKDFRKGKKWK